MHAPGREIKGGSGSGKILSVRVSGRESNWLPSDGDQSWAKFRPLKLKAGPQGISPGGFGDDQIRRQVFRDGRQFPA